MIPTANPGQDDGGFDPNKYLDMLQARGGTLTAGGSPGMFAINGKTRMESMVMGTAEMFGIVTAEGRKRNVANNPPVLDYLMPGYANTVADSAITTAAVTSKVVLGGAVLAATVATGGTLAGAVSGWAANSLVGLVGGTTLVGAGVGFVKGGLSGSGSWDWDKALAGGLSGMMVGAGVGLTLASGGLGMWAGGLASVGGSTLLGGGLSGFGAMQSGQPLDWSKWAGSTAVGAASGFASGVVGFGVGAGLGALTKVCRGEL